MFEISIHAGSTITDMTVLARLATIHARRFGGTEMREWTAEQFRSTLDDPTSRLFICNSVHATAQATIAGYAVLRYVSPEAEILTFAVDMAWQRQGIAKRILKEIDRDGRRQGIERCFLEVSEKNERAREVYAAHGFVEVGVRKRYYNLNGRKFDAHVLSKSLSCI